MKAALYNVCKKNILFWLVLSACFCGCKFLAVCGVRESVPQQEMLDQWISECAGMSSLQAEEYIRTQYGRILTDLSAYQRYGNELSMLRTSLKNKEDVDSLIDFAWNAEGRLPVNLPYHYLDSLGFYRNLARPVLINEGRADLYFDLQKYDAVIFLVILTAAFFFGRQYESGIEKVVRTMKHGRGYQRTAAVSILAAGLLFLLANELFDLLYSGMLTDVRLLNASVQSFSDFAGSQFHGRMGTCLLLQFLSRAINVTVFTLLVRLVAMWRKNVKDTMMVTFCVLFFCFFIGRALEGTRFYPLWQLGIVDWKSVMENTTLFFAGKVPAVFLGLGGGAAVMTLCAGSACRSKRF